MSEQTIEPITIWNERSKAIGGVGRDAVIKTLVSAGYQATASESEFKNHEGVAVPYGQVFPAARLVELKHGRIGG